MRQRISLPGGIDLRQQVVDWSLSLGSLILAALGGEFSGVVNILEPDWGWIAGVTSGILAVSLLAALLSILKAVGPGGLTCETGAYHREESGGFQSEPGTVHGHRLQALMCLGRGVPTSRFRRDRLRFSFHVRTALESDRALRAKPETPDGRFCGNWREWRPSARLGRPTCC